MSKSKRRICIFCQTWESGGIESFINSVLAHMDLDSLEIDVVLEQEKNSVFTIALKKLGVHFHVLSGSTHNIFSHWFSFSALLCKRKYDLIHLHLYQAVPLCYLLLAKKKGIPIRIAHSHNTMLRESSFKGLKLYIHRIFRRFFTKYATNLWACSSMAAKFMFYHRDLQERKYCFIPNAIDLKRFQKNQEIRIRKREQLHLQNCFVLGHVGRLCSQKNQIFILQIFFYFHQMYKNSRLLLVGDGEELNRLKQKSKELGISSSVIFYGTSSHVEQLLWAMDFFVFPSLFEGLGISAIEAQATGLPVICSDQIPSEAMVTSLIQRLSLNLSAEEWAKKIIKFKSNSNSESDSINMLKNAGYEIKDLGKWVEKVYRGEYKRDKENM